MIISVSKASCRYLLIVSLFFPLPVYLIFLQISPIRILPFLCRHLYMSHHVCILREFSIDKFKYLRLKTFHAVTGCAVYGLTPCWAKHDCAVHTSQQGDFHYFYHFVRLRILLFHFCPTYRTCLITIWASSCSIYTEFTLRTLVHSITFLSLPGGYYMGLPRALEKYSVTIKEGFKVHVYYSNLKEMIYTKAQVLTFLIPTSTFHLPQLFYIPLSLVLHGCKSTGTHHSKTDLFQQAGHSFFR